MPSEERGSGTRVEGRGSACPLSSLLFPAVLALLLLPAAAAAQDSVIVINPDAPVGDSAALGLPPDILAELLTTWNDSATIRLPGGLVIPAGARLSGPVAAFRGTMRVAGEVAGPADGHQWRPRHPARRRRPRGHPGGGRPDDGAGGRDRRRRDPGVLGCGAGDPAVRRRPRSPGAAARDRGAGDGGTHLRYRAHPDHDPPDNDPDLQPHRGAGAGLRPGLRMAPAPAPSPPPWICAASSAPLPIRLPSGAISAGSSGPTGASTDRADSASGVRTYSVIAGIEEQTLPRDEIGWNAFLFQRDNRDYFASEGVGGGGYVYLARRLRLEQHPL